MFQSLPHFETFSKCTVMNSSKPKILCKNQNVKQSKTYVHITYNTFLRQLRMFVAKNNENLW